MRDVVVGILAGTLAACTGSGPVILDTDTDDGDTDADVVLALTWPCEDARDDVYLDVDTTDAPPPGTPRRCALATPESQPALRERLADLPDVGVRSGYTRAVASYVTTRDPDVPGLGTASLFVPDAPAPGPLPLVVVVHDLVGLADACAPTRQDHVGQDALLLPAVASGLPVVAPDLAGLGTSGLPGLGDPTDTAHSVLDAARLAQATLEPRALSGEVLLIGHGTGAAAVLAARELAPAYAPELDVTHVIALAGAPPLRDPTSAWRLAHYSVAGADGYDRTALALELQADFAALFGEDTRADPFDVDVAAPLVAAAADQCQPALQATLATPTDAYVPPDTLGQLVDDDFRKEVIGCIDVTERCTDRALAYMERKRAGVVEFGGGDGPEVVVVSGARDVRETLAEQACLVEALEDGGVEPVVCVVDEGHDGVVAGSVGFWLAVALGDAAAGIVEEECAGGKGDLGGC